MLCPLHRSCANLLLLLRRAISSCFLNLQASSSHYKFVCRLHDSVCGVFIRIIVILPPPKWTAALSSWFVFTRSWTSWPGACPNQGASCILHLTTTASLCKLICTMTALGQDIFEKSLILFRIEVPHLSPLPLSQCRVSYLPILSPWCVSGVN